MTTQAPPAYAPRLIGGRWYVVLAASGRIVSPQQDREAAQRIADRMNSELALCREKASFL